MFFCKCFLGKLRIGEITGSLIFYEFIPIHVGYGYSYFYNIAGFCVLTSRVFKKMRTSDD